MSDGGWDSDTAAEQGNYGGDEGGYDNDGGHGAADAAGAAGRHFGRGQGHY